MLRKPLPEFWGNQFWQFDIATQIPNQSAFALCGWGGAASSVSHVGSTLFSDRDRLLQFQTHVSVKHDAQFDYSHPTSRVNFQKRENWAPPPPPPTLKDKWMSDMSELKGWMVTHIFQTKKIVRDEQSPKMFYPEYNGSFDMVVAPIYFGWDFFSERDQEFWCENWKKL